MDPMSETQESATQGATVDPVETVPQPATDTAPETGQEQQAETETAPEPEEKPKQTPWFQKRIDELTRNWREAERRETAYAAALRNIQQGQQPPQNQEGQPPAGFVPVSELARVEHAVAERLQFNAACDAIADAGPTQFPDFHDALSTLISLGVDTQNPRDAFMQVVTGLGDKDGAAAIHALGMAPDEAQRILGLPPARMGLEIARLAAKPPAPKPVSKVPPPIAPIAAARVDPGAEPDATRNPEAYRKWFAEQRRNR